MSGELSVDRDSDDGSPRLRGPADRSPFRAGQPRGDEANSAQYDISTLHAPFDPFARCFDHVGGYGKAKSAIMRLEDDRLRDNVLRRLIQRGRCLQDLFWRLPWRSINPNDPRATIG
jgi:hypothetical protein